MERTAAWLALQMAGLSPAEARALAERFGGPEHALNASQEEVREAGFPPKVVARLRNHTALAAEEELGRARNAGISVLAIDDERYPGRLRLIPDPPVVLFIRGEILPGDDIALAVVGTRHPTPYGLRMATKLSGELAQLGMTIVSGLARGIDAAAHRAALAAGGRTIAVLGSGLLRLYPPEHAELADRICRAGAVVSEFPLTMPPLKENFPRRNRVISGLARGTLVVEAGTRSGALITARLALDQNREVFALPGQADTLTSSGTNRLIRDGACLVETSRDILDGLNLTLQATAPPSASGGAPEGMSDDERTVLARLDRPRSFEELLMETSLPPAALASLLAGLEVKGAVRCLPGRWYEKLP